MKVAWNQDTLVWVFFGTSAGDITATTTEMSSTFPPVNTLPCSLARLAKGTSSSAAVGSQLNLELIVLRGLRSDTRPAREQSASESIPASVRRPSKLVVVVGIGGVLHSFSSPSWAEEGDPPEEAGKKLLLILTTSSNTSSSHKLSLNPSEASMSISSCSMGRVNVLAWVEGLDGERGPSWTGVLKLHHISSLLHTITSPLTSIPIQSPKCAILSTAPLPPPCAPVSFLFIVVSLLSGCGVLYEYECGY